jgi:hypothetical protein
VTTKSKAIAKKIRRDLPDSFSKTMFRSALRVADDTKNPGRANQFSASMRSLLEHLLDTFAPAKSVTECGWFKPPTNTGLPSRRQRAIYAVQGGLSHSYVRNELGLDPAALCRPVVVAIDALSRCIHARPRTLIRGRSKIEAFVEQSLTALETFLTAIKDCKSRLRRALWEPITKSIVERTISDAIDDIDALATHHYIDEHQVEDVEISISSETITYQVQGIFCVTLQFGSNSDFKRDQGVLDHTTVPFSCSLTAPADNPESVELDHRSLQVDTSEYYADQSA